MGTPLSQRHCYLSTGPLDTVADLCTQAGKQGWHRDAREATRTEAMSGSPINRFAHKYQNNNSFYSTREGQINTFLLQQIKMNNVIGMEAERVFLGWAIYSARYMRNDVQFGRVVIWNGTNELLSAEVTSVDGATIIYSLHLSSGVIWLCATRFNV